MNQPTAASTAIETDNAIRPQLTRQHVRVLLLVSTLSMITYLDRVCFGVAAPLIAGELNLSGVADLKWAFTAFSIAYAIFEIPTGWLGDRLGPRAMLIRIVLWWSACTALTGLIGWQYAGFTFGGLTTLIVLRFLFGAGEAGAYPNIARAIYNWFPANRWELAQGYVWMSGRLMGGLTPFIWMLLVTGTALTPALVTWRGAFLLFAMIGVGWCLLFRLYFTNHPPQETSVESMSDGAVLVRPSAPGGHEAVPWRWLLTNRNLLILCLAYTFVNYGWAFNITYLPAYLAQRFEGQASPLWMAVFAGAPLWVGAIGCIVGGFYVSGLDRLLHDRRRARKWACLTAMLGCAGCWWLAWQAQSVFAFSFSVAMAAFCVDLTLGATWATCQDIGRNHTAVAAGLMNTIGTIGAAIAAWLTGTIVQRAIAAQAAADSAAGVEFTDAAQQAAALGGFQNVFLTYLVIYIAAAACWLFLRPQDVERNSFR